MKNERTTKDLANLLKTAFQINEEAVFSVEKLKYVVYARKSTESEERQIRSLGDQIIECQELSKRLGLNIVKIIKESESAKEPDIRPKFREMLDNLNKGKYDGVIAWHPDRIARNMKDAGEVIDLLDKRIIKDLKFVSFTFENNTSGKMLLGISFVISKQYSDQLSDNVKRGIKGIVEEGKFLGRLKHGYKKDPNDFLRPDGNNFQLIKESFRKRIKGETIQKIANFLNKNKYSPSRKKKGKEYKMDKKKVSAFLRDPFYTGVLMYGKNVIDLTSIYNFIPIVGVDNFLKMNKLSNINKAFKLARKLDGSKNIKANLMRGMVLCDKCKKPMSSGITNKKTKKGTTRYFYYRCESYSCKNKNKSVRAKIIIDFIFDLLKNTNFTSKKIHKRYISSMKNITMTHKKSLENKLKSLNQQKSNLENKSFATKEFLINEEDTEIKNSFKKDFKKAENDLKIIRKDITKTKEATNKNNNVILTYQEFLELFKNLPYLIKKTKDIRDLDFIIKKLFSNFTIKDGKVAYYTLKAPFKELLETSKVSNGRGERTRTSDLIVPNDAR